MPKVRLLVLVASASFLVSLAFAPAWGAVTEERALNAGVVPGRIAAGILHACGLKTDGSVACWGNDDNGRATPPGGTV